MRDVIIACDFSSREELFNFLKPFEGYNPYLKVGMELFYAEGPDMVKELKEKGFKIFLDLKLYDIPNTVKKAMVNLGKLGVDITNVHASGGITMMKAAKDGLLEGAKMAGYEAPLLIAVTQLTSTDQAMLERELCIHKKLSDVVFKYAENAKSAGLDGVVCSPFEAASVEEIGLVSVTPGIRLIGDDVGDQKRVTTPKIAKELGSSFIVVGRSITAARDPLAAYLECKAQFN
ncbi:MAG: orotidine-5'-phosphate decarboxylase [Christensenellales bacterium]|jgi:orotidine-5'-phosphate decarboxylase|nr:orotidine-5'-phosphate decarboxylase [Clostridiales bacterium]